MSVITTAAALTHALAISPANTTIPVSGSFPGFSIKRALRPGITIQQAPDAPPAFFPDLVVQGFGGMIAGPVTFQGVHVVRGRVESARGVHFLGCPSAEPGQTDPTKCFSSGISAIYSHDIQVKGCDFSYLFRGVSFYQVTDFDISGNHFHDMRSDGIDVGSPSSTGKITRNIFERFVPVFTEDPTKDDHSDAIQFTIQKAATGAHDILVAHNLIDFRGSPNSEGVLVGDQPLTGVHYDGFTFDNNLIVGSANPKGPGGGLQIFHTTNARVTNTTIVALAGGRYALVSSPPAICQGVQLQKNGCAGPTNGVTIIAPTDAEIGSMIDAFKASMG